MSTFFKKLFPKNRIFLFFLTDIIAINIASFFALFLRFEFFITDIPSQYIQTVQQYFIPNTIITLAIFMFLKLYRSVWTFAGEQELVNISIACTLSALAQFCGMTLFKLTIPRSYHIFYFFGLLILLVLSRFAYRLLRFFYHKNHFSIPQKHLKSIMLIGAGEAGSIMIKEIQSSSYLNKRIMCVIDDNPIKKGKFLRGVKIVGDRNSIVENAQKYNIDEIIIALPSATPIQRKEIINICQQTDCTLKTLPGMYQLINGEVSVSKLKNVDIEDLLGRESVQVDLSQIMGYVKDQTVLITGGGGSIGSELCRQIAAYKPKQLIIFDIYENNAYQIQQELLKKFPELNLTVLIGSVRNAHRINTIFNEYKPDIVYHAAAHKHVPLMEDSPNEAIKNNVFGTYTTALAAHKNNVKKFVLISTDKAVNPTNIMGASKRLCEMIIQMMSSKSDTEFVAVRFGNVLGSNGSVIPLFKEQILNGGPITVTHPDIIRYFMTIPEAVSLVLQAGSLAKGGEIFVLDMGEPVKIVDLAKNLIKLSGYKIDEDIKIEFSGLRPGEKLYEELLMEEEGLKQTNNQLIFIGKPIEFDVEVFLEQLTQLRTMSENDSKEIKAKVSEIVQTYKPNLEDITV